MSSVPIGDNLPSSMFFWPTPERPMVERGEGIYLWDQDGKRYIDGSSGPQTANIGHGNARVREAMVAQAEKVSYAFRSHFLNEPAELLAHEIAEMTPEGLDQVFFGSGGSEVVEACIKLARQYALATNQATRYKVISRLPSYHGTTLGALSLPRFTQTKLILVLLQTSCMSSSRSSLVRTIRASIASTSPFPRLMFGSIHSWLITWPGDVSGPRRQTIWMLAATWLAPT